jgi:phosphatidylglycerophosphatase A
VASVVGVFLFYPILGHPVLHGILLVALLLLGVRACGRLEREEGFKDPSHAVIDEVLGIGIALWAVPQEWYYVVSALLLFRVFDIWKPFPIRKAEKLPGGWGVMMDDVLAGTFARVWVQVGIWTTHFLQ